MQDTLRAYVQGDRRGFSEDWDLSTLWTARMRFIPSHSRLKIWKPSWVVVVG